MGRPHANISDAFCSSTVRGDPLPRRVFFLAIATITGPNQYKTCAIQTFSNNYVDILTQGFTPTKCKDCERILPILRDEFLQLCQMSSKQVRGRRKRFETSLAGHLSQISKSNLYERYNHAIKRTKQGKAPRAVVQIYQIMLFSIFWNRTLQNNL